MTLVILEKKFIPCPTNLQQSVDFVKHFIIIFNVGFIIMYIHDIADEERDSGSAQYGREL